EDGSARHRGRGGGRSPGPCSPPAAAAASRAIARELGLSHATVAAIRRRWGLGAEGAVPTRPPLPGADVWVMGLYADGRRAVLLAGTRPVPAPPAAAVATVIGEDVLTGLADALEAVRTAAEPAAPDLPAYLAEAAAHHPDIALHAITLWDTAPEQPPTPGVTGHRLPANATWRSFLRAVIALDSTSHPESSRRVYLDLIAALARRAARSAGCAKRRRASEGAAPRRAAGAQQQRGEPDRPGLVQRVRGHRVGTAVRHHHPRRDRPPHRSDAAVGVPDRPVAAGPRRPGRGVAAQSHLRQAAYPRCGCAAPPRTPSACTSTPRC
ncbi:hypothetical protein GA0115240_12641, partial [Streptomyces sp. DvalAA-14]